MNRAGKHHLPASIRSTLWSYDVRGVDIQRDRELIITQALNYGNWQAVRWLLNTYGVGAIKRVIRQPRRGVWWPRALNFWKTMLDVRIPKPALGRALIRVTCQGQVPPPAGGRGKGEGEGVMRCKLSAVSGKRAP